MRFISLLILLLFPQVISQEYLYSPEETECTRIIGTCTVCGKLVWIKPVNHGFDICIENSKEKYLVAFLDQKTSIVYQDHQTHERKELKADKIFYYIKFKLVESIMIGVYKGIVSDIILISPLVEEKEETEDK